MFRTSEGDAWHERNKLVPRFPDPVLDCIEACFIHPKSVVEIGCGTGWRLAEIEKKYNPRNCVGYEPSGKAIEERVFANVFQRTAIESLPFVRKRYYDLIIFGFCLYLVDREDLFTIVTAADSALQDKGHIIIHDFIPEYRHKQAYKHKVGMWSYKMDYSKLWLANPAYRGTHVQHTEDGNDSIGVSILQKDMANAFPVRTP